MTFASAISIPQHDLIAAGTPKRKVKERKYLKVIKTFERINRLIGRFLNGIFSNVVTELQHLSKTKMYNPCFKNN